MEFNNALMGFPMPTMRNFQSKAEALQFAIEFTANSSMGGRKAEPPKFYGNDDGRAK